MLVFVIPLKSPQVSNNWQRVSQLFERCVKSACHQTSENFRVVAVCHEKPIMEFEHPHFSCLEVDFPLPKEKNRIARGLTDKGRKIVAGLTYARQFNPTHAMSVDADDCVSKYLAEFVGKYPQENGWFLHRGYKYQEGSQFIYLKRRNFYRMAGTANIIRYDLLDLPEVPEYNRGYGYYKFHVDHQKVKDFMWQKGAPIKPLPFAASVYTLGAENMSGNLGNLSFSIFDRQRLTPKIREEFNLYHLE